jgi:hypothetical protein
VVHRCPENKLPSILPTPWGGSEVAKQRPSGRRSLLRWLEATEQERQKSDVSRQLRYKERSVLAHLGIPSSRQCSGSWLALDTPASEADPLQSSQASLSAQLPSWICPAFSGETWYCSRSVLPWRLSQIYFLPLQEVMPNRGLVKEAQESTLHIWECTWASVLPLWLGTEFYLKIYKKFLHLYLLAPNIITENMDPVFVTYFSL